MAEFQKVMADAKRMCDYYSGKEDCERCPLHDIGCMPDMDDPDMVQAFEATVVNWVNTHPEVYPTWNEWMHSLGVTEPNSRISQELARRFGIEAVTIECLNKAVLCQYYECGLCSGTKEMETCKGIGCGRFKLGLG